jgi:DNA adenine methylase
MAGRGATRTRNDAGNGGKRQLAARVIQRIEQIPHRVYCEPFVGMGGLFFRRRLRPPAEAINDRSKDVATFFRILQRHFNPFLDMLKWQIASRAEFDRLMATDPDTLTDLERAARFLYLQRLSFGGKVAARSFGVDTHGPARFNVSRLVPLLEAAHERLGGVYIECLPWREFIERWDRPEALFVCDPPYWGSENYYGRGMFDRTEFEALAAALKGLRGSFVMTINDVPEIRKMFAWATIEAAELTYTVGGNGKAKAVRELIIHSTRRPVSLT